SSPGQSEGMPLQPLRNTGPLLDHSRAPRLSIFLSAPAKHRPPPLQLRPFGPAFSSSFELIDEETTPVEPYPSEDSPLSLLPSPWFLVDDLPSPPLKMPRSRTSISVSKIFRLGGNVHVEASPTSSKLRDHLKECKGEQDENVPSTPKHIRRRKRTKSFGSLGKGFRPPGALEC
ncbi:hypothetical protein FRC12_017452, partial [Ceratobasidium sp. 428]